MRRFSFFCTSLVSLLSGISLASNAVDAPPPFTDIDFLALINGQASIIHVDRTNHTTVEPVEFLKGHVVLAWDAVTLDQVVTCEKSLNHEDELEFKYYKNKVLMQTFWRKTATYVGKLEAPYWMLLLPEKNCLLINQFGRSGVDRFDLSTKTKKESTFPPNSGYPEARSNPLWDPVKHNLIIAVEDKALNQNSPQYFLARLDPDDLTLSGEVPVGLNSLVDQMLYQDPASNNVVFYGEVGGIVAHWGNAGFYMMPQGGGAPKLLMEGIVFGVMPGTPIGATHFTAVINRRYAITTRGRNGSIPDENSNDAHTYLVDLKTHDVQMLDIPYVNWPISQEGLHVPVAPTTQTAVPIKSN